jgi:hypothetical protein
MISPAFRRVLASLFAMLCLALAAPAQGGSFTIDIAGCSNPQPSYSNGVLTIGGCGTGTTTAGAPAGCSISASPSSLPAGGGLVSLTMTCTSGAPTSYSWSGGGVNGTGATVSTNITATTTFTATASNAVGPSAQVSKQVTVGSAAPGTGGGGAIRCDGFNATHVIDFNWNGVTGNQKFVASGAGPNDAVVARFTTGSTTATTSGWITAGEYGSAPATRLAVLSATPCEFGTGLAKYAVKMGQTPNVRFYVGTAPLNYPQLAPNTTYYFNVKTTGGCSDGTSCQMLIELSKPSGL